MNKKLLFTFIVFALMIGILVRPSHAFALGLNFDASISKISVGNTTLVKVYVDTAGKEINALQGTLQITGPVKISGVDTGGSIFNLWPEQPELVQNQEITFTGGTGGGVYGNKLRVFNFYITPISEGNITFTPVGLTGYLNDGLGTTLAGDKTSFTTEVVGQSDNSKVSKSSSSIADDKTPPEPFTITLGRDESIFDGKYFISFYATDSDSGINRYEVKEGDSAFVASDNTYVLKDQTLRSNVYVKAIDNAGNERIEVLNGAVHTPLIWKLLEIILIIVVVLIVGYFLYKILRKKINKK